MTDKNIPQIQPETIPENADSEQVQSVVIEESRSLHIGPLPSPETLQAYNDIIPGSAERIIRMAECEQAHVQEMDKTVVNKEYSDRRLGMWFGLIATLAFVLSALASLWLGAPWVAGLFVSASALGVISAFIKGRSQTAKSTSPPEEANIE